MFFKKGYLIEPKEDAALPKTRGELFKTIFKENFSLLVDVGILIGIFSIPLYYLLYSLLHMISALQDKSVNELFPLIFWSSIIALPFFALRAISEGAVHELLKKRSFGEGFDLVETLMESLKKNWLKFLLIGLIKGFFFALFIIGSLFVLLTSMDSLGKGVSIGILLLLFFLSFSSGEFAYSQIPIYDNKLKATLKNGLIFTFLSFLPAFLFFLVSFLLPLVLISMWPITFFIVLILYITLLEGLLLCASSLYAQSRFDKFINKDNYPDHLRKGLAPLPKEGEESN